MLSGTYRPTPAAQDTGHRATAVRGYCARMGAVRRLAQKLAWRPYRFRRARAMPGDYLRNRVARLTLDLKTGAAQIER